MTCILTADVALIKFQALPLGRFAPKIRCWCVAPRNGWGSSFVRWMNLDSSLIGAFFGVFDDWCSHWFSRAAIIGL